MNINDLKSNLDTAQRGLTMIEEGYKLLESVGMADDIPQMTNMPRRRSSTPSPSGARRSIVHPNETDRIVLDTFLAQSNPNEITKAEIVDQLTGKVSPKDVDKSIKFFKESNRIGVEGKGRGTKYMLRVTSNDIQVSDESQDATNYRNNSGPTVVQMVRAVFNGVQPLEKLKPSELKDLTKKMFPAENLVDSSFGTVFAEMSKNNEIFFEGKAKARRYWRGPELLENAAEVSESDDDDTRPKVSTETDVETTSTEEINEEENNEAVAAKA